MMRRVLGALAVLATVAAPGADAAGPWTTPAPVPGSSGVGFPYDVAAQRDGTVAVAFIQDGVRVALRSPDGAWTRPEKVSEGRTGVASPDVAVGARGEVIVAWTQNTVHGATPPQGPSYVRAAIRHPDGRWGAARTIGRTGHFIDAQPRLAANARGDAVLAWRGLSASGPRARDVLQTAYRRSAGAFGPPRSLREPGIDLQVAVDDRGTAYAVWSHTRPPYHLASSIRVAIRPRTASWARPATVYADSAGGPRVALPGDGDLVVAWRGGQVGVGATRTGFAMVSARRPDGIIEPQQLLSHTRTVGPQLAVGASGETLIAWSAPSEALDPTAGAPQLYWAARPRGGAFGPVQAAPGLRAGPLAMLADGTAVTVWSATALRAAVRPPTGAFGQAEPIAAHGDFPVLAAGDDIAVAVWLSGGRLMAAARPAP
jgi:hypothetical protein